MLKTVVILYLFSTWVFAQKVIVIGGGLAGLRAALGIKDQLGVSVVILEARNRVGGRAHSLWDENTKEVMEAGGELIGNNHTEWKSLAKRYNLELIDLPGEDSDSYEPILLNNEVISGPESKKLFDDMKEAIKLIVKEAEIIKNPLKPWKEEQAVQDLDKISFGDKLKSMPIDPRVKDLIAMQFSHENVSSIYDQSWLGIMMQIKGGGGDDYLDNFENFTCQEGSQALACKIAQDLLDHDVDLKLNAEVKKITTKDGVVTVEGIQSGTAFSIKGDYVVLATPQTTWPELEIEPKLMLADYTMSSGPALKVCCQIEKDSEICFETQSLAGASWSAPKSLENNIYGFDQLNWDKEKNQLQRKYYDNFIFFAGGPKCLEENLVEQQRQSFGLMNGKDFAVYNTCVINWVEKKHSKTGYSYMGVNKLSVLKNLNKYIEPNKMVIVGESVHPVWYGFMEGALESGLAGAKKICKKIEKLVPKPK